MEILGYDWHVWMTLAVFAGMYITLAKSKIHSDIVFFVAVVILTLSGCLSVKEALSGFSSESVVVMGVLYIVIAGLEATGAMNWMANHLLGTPKSYASALMRLMLPVSLFSAFINNPTVVTLFGKVSKVWTKTLNIPMSKLLIPISYAATLGGSLTILGTASNLIVTNFFTDGAGVHIGMFAPFIPAMACLIVGLGLTVLQRKLLPVRKNPEDELDIQSTTTTTELTIPSRSHLVGLSLAESNILAHNKDCNLIGIIHFDSEVDHITSDEDPELIYLMGGDTLVFTGNKESVLNIAKAYDMHYGVSLCSDEVKPGRKAVLSSLIMVMMIVLPAIGAMPLIYSCFLAAVLMLATKCCSMKQGKKAINWDILVVYACSVSIGNAFCHTGIDSIVSGMLSSLCGGSALIAFITICAFTSILTEFLNNPVCAAVIAPIGVRIALDLGANPVTFCVGILIAVATSFATPIGSVTNLVVYTPGGYKFTDFTRIGIPINLAVLVTNIVVTLLVFPL